MPTPIVLITGFLGAGKTTFLNWLIQTHPDIKISLILNEFGEIKLESQFIQQNGGGEVAELSNGCMCCLAKKDIPRVIQYILEHAPQTQYIVIEASGLSDPDPIRATLQEDALQKRIFLSSTLCIVDAAHYEENTAHHPIILSQIADANIILLSKVEQAGEEKTKRVQQAISKLGVGTNVMSITPNLSPALFLHPDPTPSQPLSHVSDETQHEHLHDAYQQFWFITEKTLDLEKFKLAMNNLPSTIIRSKGFVLADGKKHMVQYVGNTLELQESSWKDDEKKQTAILFIGQQLDQNTLEQTLRNCEVTSS